MLERLRSFQLAPRNDVLLFLGLDLGLFALTIVWALLLAEPIFRVAKKGNNYLILLLLFLFALLAALIPYLTWGRRETRPRARFMVRFGLALQIFAVTLTLPAIYFASNPVVAVPIGFATFLAMFTGVFLAGFGGNMLAPPRG
ncbi:hypothetical protein [Kallotenue papyrolyticum]|uniref:hypothetical protein n=1 Tax=Kallotenue papyrolyticum TaxID=1325125 RepID=UPI0004786116|nr:hypothetical protein [Kallotenue papyrolyticum]